MAKVRVYELAAEFGVETKVVMDRLREMDELIRSASSTIEAPVVQRLRESLRDRPAARRRQEADRDRDRRQPASPAPASPQAAATPAPALSRPEPVSVLEQPTRQAEISSPSGSALSRDSPPGQPMHQARASEELSRLAREVAAAIRPSLELRLQAAYGPTWLPAVNKRMRAEHRGHVKSLSDHRSCLKVYGFDPATEGWTTVRRRSMALAMADLANQAVHDEPLTDSDLMAARAIHQEF